MKRALALIGFAFGLVRRDSRRSLALAVGVGITVFAFASVSLYSGALQAAQQETVEALPDLVVQKTRAGRPALLSADLSTQLAEFPAVRSARPRVWGYLYVPSLDANLTIVGEAAERQGAAVGDALAERLGLIEGDHLVLPGANGPATFRVEELLSGGASLFAADAVILPMAKARALLGLAPDEAVDIALELTTPDEAEVITRRVLAAVPLARVIDKRHTERLYSLSLGARSGWLFALSLPALVILLLLAWDRLSAFTSVERREVAILKALGWHTSEVLLTRMLASGLLALVGTTFGYVLAYVHVFVLGAPLIARLFLGWSTLYPTSPLSAAVDAGDVFGVVALVVLPFCAASTIPAWRTATADPGDVLRDAL